MLLLLTVLPLVPAAATESPLNRLQTDTARKQTIRAMQMLDQDQWTVGRDILASTKDPLASKLYYWMTFTRERKGYEYVHLAQFIRHNPEWPGIKGMRELAERSMPSSLTPAEITAWFADYPPLTARGTDRYLQALFEQGRRDLAKQFLANWWADTLMSRDEQKGLYAKYGIYIDREAHTRRLDRLLFASQYTNARAIASLLGPGYPELAEARIALAEEKSEAGALIDRVPRKLQEDPGLLYERLRWRRKKDLDVEAMEILHKNPPSDRIQNPEDWWKERHIIIRRLIERKSYESAYLLAEKHMQKEGAPYAEAEWMAGWLALRFLNKPQRALEHFEALYAKVETPMSKSRASYWAGRAAKAMGAQDVAQKWYQDAASFQTVFYGQMAGAELGMEEALPNAAPPAMTAQDKAAFNAREMVQAAKIFHDAGMRKESSRFIQTFAESENTPKAFLFAAETAADLGRYHDAVKISKEATKQGLFLTAQSFPVITDKLRAVPIEWSLVHAIIRQESMFDPSAESPAGALGMMQLMPGTARETANKLGIPHQTSWLTQKPDHNIRLGSKYLSDMIDRFDGSYPMAAAAYNAGPGRVNGWIKDFGDPRNGQVDLIDWIEMIPISETRNYVQRVMEVTYVYRLRLKNVQKQPFNPIHIASQKNY